MRKIYVLTYDSGLSITFGNKKALWQYLTHKYHRSPFTKHEINSLTTDTFSNLKSIGVTITCCQLITKFDPSYEII